MSVIVPVHKTGTMEQDNLLLLGDFIKELRLQTKKLAELLLAGLRQRFPAVLPLIDGPGG